jgi:hypothetical protein
LMGNLFLNCLETSAAYPSVNPALMRRPPVASRIAEAHATRVSLSPEPRTRALPEIEELAMRYLGYATQKTILSSTLVLAGVTMMASNAFAVSLRVQIACANDYYAHCSAFNPGSPQVRSCMRAVGAGLSKHCVDALVAAGEVSSTEVSRRRAASQTASR